MDSGRRLEILSDLVGGRGDAGSSMARVCAFGAVLTTVSGAGTSLMDGDVLHGPIYTTDRVSARVEELQFMFGEGPRLDASRDDLSVVEPDLAEPVTPRWSAFS
jgi:hypothetical protein